jgi:predicted amidohydrolase
LDFFKAEGQVTIKDGEPYPVSHHDPSDWLPEDQANTNPAKFPTRDLSFTASLRIGTGNLGYTYVLDFNLWNRLSVLGATDNGLVMSAAQPNLDAGEFDYSWPPTVPPKTFANHGPNNAGKQVDRIVRLVDEATAQGAEVVVLPEYSVSEDVYNALVTSLPRRSTVPIIFCAGLVRDTLAATGYMQNFGWLLLSTPGISLPHEERFHAKTSAATIAGAVERIKPTSEVRVFVGETWSLCVLVCVEVLATEIVDQLADIGTNLILVPSMSPRTMAMTNSVSRLCTESQAFVVMANGPASWPPSPASPCEAFFAGPYGSLPSSWSPSLADPGRNKSQIATWVFPALEQGVSRRQLPA